MRKNIFFDLDGTLTDPAEGITRSVLYALSRFGIRESDRERLLSFIGTPLTDSFREHYGFSPEKALEAAMAFQEYFVKKGMLENRVYEGVDLLLSELTRRGKCLVLATSKPEPFAVKILEHFRLREYFSYVCGAETDEKTRMKKEDVIRYALEKSGFSGAKCFGMATVGVLYGYGSAEELKEAGADVLCRDLLELKEVLFS